jgi:hypothetical protein
MRNALIMVAALTLLLAAGCKNNQSSTTAGSSNAPSTTAASSDNASSLSPEELGTLGAQIKKQPNDADKLLAQRGLNEQSFAAAIRKVSEDPAAAKRYTAAYKGAS